MLIKIPFQFYFQHCFLLRTLDGQWTIHMKMISNNAKRMASWLLVAFKTDRKPNCHQSSMRTIPNLKQRKNLNKERKIKQ